MEFPSFGGSDILVGIASALGVVSSYVLYLRRKISHDNSEILKDRTEIDIIKTLQDERDKAIQERNDVIKRMGIIDAEKNSLTNKVESLTFRLTDVTSEVSSIHDLLKLHIAQEDKQFEIIDKQINGIIDTLEETKEYVISDSVIPISSMSGK